MASSREIKNLRIAESNRQTRMRRQSQVPLTFELGVRNEKRNRKTGCFRHLKMICVESESLSVDTPRDLERVRMIMEERIGGKEQYE